MPLVPDTLIIRFGEDVASTALATLELDDEYNDGASSFAPDVAGVGLLFHCDSNLQLERLMVSNGSFNIIGPVTRSETNRAIFPSTEDKVTLGHNPISVSGSFYGRTPSLIVNGREVSASIDCCICELTHSFNATSIILRPPSGLELDEDETYPILVVGWVGTR